MNPTKIVADNLNKLNDDFDRIKFILSNPDKFKAIIQDECVHFVIDGAEIVECDYSHVSDILVTVLESMGVVAEK